MRRPLWTYRPALCLLGLHATSERRASTTTKVGGMLHPAYRVIAECDRPGCTYSAVIEDAVVVPLSACRIIPDQMADS